MPKEIIQRNALADLLERCNFFGQFILVLSYLAKKAFGKVYNQYGKNNPEVSGN